MKLTMAASALTAVSVTIGIAAPVAASAFPTNRATPSRADARDTADKYRDYADLARNEEEGQDYRRSLRWPPGAKAAHIAIHGGAIEAGTTQLADHAARARQSYGFYSFEGIKSEGNQDLHITSTRFDEPKGLKLAQGVSYTISWHGMSGDTARTYIGGRDALLRSRVVAALKEADFSVEPAPDDLDGMSKENIVNKNRRGMGVQLELTTAQRRAFFADGKLNRAWIEDPSHQTTAFKKYTAAVDKALATVAG
ncbi:poly-gamma-glutamate hydrolase family protein [Actinomadura sp. 9N215]|uniref:poly-gamma-glutamate hydrolase family protein n=1 Tax=Actinomadura sp. 9N215 TaxID=3375150 RepID=UPI0037B2300D